MIKQLASICWRLAGVARKPFSRSRRYRPSKSPAAAFLLCAWGMTQATSSVMAAPFVYVTSTNDTIRIIDVATNRVIGDAIPVGEDPQRIAFTPDGRHALVTNGRSGTFSMIDARTRTLEGAPIAVTATPFPDAIAISPNGQSGYVGSGWGYTVRVISPITRRLIGDPLPVGRYIWDIAFTPDGARVYVSTTDQVSVIESARNEIVDRISLPGCNAGIAITPDGQRAYVANCEADTVSVIDMMAGTVLRAIRVPGATWLAMAPDGRRVYVTGVDAVFVIDTATDELVAGPITVRGGAFRLALTPDGMWAYVRGDNVVSVIDTATNSIIGRPIPVSGDGLGIAITPFVPFDSFRATLTLDEDAAKLRSRIYVCSEGTPKALLTQPVTLQVGSAVTTLPAGSFHATGRNGFVADLRHRSVKLSVKIKSLETNCHMFDATAKDLDLDLTAKPVEVVLKIGGQGGATYVTPEIH